jgi:uncharacterized protein YceK
LGADGSYSSPTPTSDLLVDLIALGKDSKDPGTCGNGGTPYPNNNSGFFVCKSGNLAELHVAADALESQTSKNSLAKDANKNSTEYGIVSQAYTRASDGVPITVDRSTTLTFAESARVFTVVTSGCSSVTSIAFSTKQVISGVVTSTTETWNPSTTNSWITTGTISPVKSGSLSTTPSLTFTIGSSNNQVTATTGSCVFSLSLRRG